MNSITGESPHRTYTYGPPTKAGKVTFIPPGTDLKCETAYWLWGDLASEVTPLIVLHGGPGAPGRDWKVISVLQEKRGIPVVLYDQIGCGASTRLPSTRGDTSFWTMNLFLAELENLKLHLKIEKFDLLGHSCGGEIVVAYALTQPIGLRKLVIASAPAAYKLRLQAQLRQRTELPQSMQDIMTKCEEEGRLHAPGYASAVSELMRRHFCRLDPWPPELQETMELVQEDDTVGFTLFGSNPFNPSGPRVDLDFRSRLPEITEKTAPGGVLLTNGRYDSSPDEVMEPFFTGIGARVKWVRFEESSHVPHLEEPQAYETAVGDFLMTNL